MNNIDYFHSYLENVCKISNKVSYLWAFTDPAIVLSMFMLSFFFVIVCGLLSGNESVIVGVNPIIRGDSWDPNKASYIFNTWEK